MAGTPNTYSFASVNAVVADAASGISVQIANGAGVSGEGITVAMNEEKATMSIGADGTPMHSVHKSKGGRIVVRIQKTSPTHAIIDQIYRYTANAGGANYGQITITLNDLARGDVIVGSQCGIAKRPDLSYAVEGGAMEWVFNVGILEWVLGSGVAA